MVMKKTITAFIKPLSQPAMFVDVHKHTMKLHPTHKNMVRMLVLKGWKRSLFSKSNKMGSYEEYDIPTSSLYAYPGGIEQAMLAPDKCIFICGVRKECYKDLMSENQRMLVRQNNTELELAKYKDMYEKVKKQLDDIHKINARK